MGLEKLLKQHKSDIIAKWFDLVVSTYPPDTARFLQKQRDPFANPVGQTTRSSLETVFDQLLGDELQVETLTDALDPVIRIRAVQQFTPSQAVAFTLDLGTVIREVLGKELRDDRQYRQLAPLERKIDRICMTAFDIYMLCREKVFNLKVATERDRIYSAFSRAGLIVEEAADGPNAQGPKPIS